MKGRSSSKDQNLVPKLYKAAGKILKQIKEDGASVKTLVYDQKYKHYNIPALFALVNEAHKKWDLLEKVIEKTGIFSNNTKLDPWLGRVLMVDIIRGKCCKSECRPVLYVQQYTDAIREIIAAHTDKSQDKLRYVRVNTLKASVEDTIKWFIEVEGWKLLTKSTTYKDHLQMIQDQLLPKSYVFCQDFHIPEVLVFPSGHGQYFYQLNLEGIILQDKASCLDGFLLKPEKGGIVLDMCAAPGMKTSHVAAIMENTGKIYAVEKDPSRFKTLQDRLSQSGVRNVKTINKDVSRVGPELCPGVEYIILDPSCSGSGLSDRKEHIDETRLQKLGGMQFALLRHALTSFPSVKRVLYSTCSTHPQENEEVIQSALDKVQHDFHLVDLTPRLTGWINFGSDEFSFGSKCIYARPNIDRTTGFFVALFERNSVKSEEHTERTLKEKKLLLSQNIESKDGLVTEVKLTSDLLFETNRRKNTRANFVKFKSNAEVMSECKSSECKLKVKTKQLNTKNRLKFKSNKKYNVFTVKINKCK